jgi:hypothetical protein
VHCSDGKWVDILEEFPIKLLPELAKHTGHAMQPDGTPKLDTRVLIWFFQYGVNFSGNDNIFTSESILFQQECG